MAQNVPIIIRPDGTTEALAYTPPKDEENSQEIQASLTTLQNAVGGYIETVAVREDDSLILLVNEDGLSLELPHNAPASALAHRHIVGNAILLPKALLC
jgi:hypothetical protein